MGRTDVIPCNLMFYFHKYCSYLSTNKIHILTACTSFFMNIVKCRSQETLQVAV